MIHPAPDDLRAALYSRLYHLTGRAKELTGCIEEEEERIKAFIAARKAKKEKLQELLKTRKDLLTQIKNLPCQ